MTKDELDQLIEAIPPQITERIGELHEKIMMAAAEELEASQDDPKAKPKVDIKLTISINLLRSPVTFKTAASVGITCSTKGEEVSIKDPNQPELFDDHA